MMGLTWKERFVLILASLHTLHSSNESSSSYTFGMFYPLSTESSGLGACYCDDEPCAVSCGAYERTFCISWMRQPSASVCASQCLQLAQCRAFEFELHIGEAWCHLFSAVPSASSTFAEDGRAFDGKYCFVRGDRPSRVPAFSAAPTEGPTTLRPTRWPVFPSDAPSDRHATVSSIPTSTPELSVQVHRTEAPTRPWPTRSPTNGTLSPTEKPDLDLIEWMSMGERSSVAPLDGLSAGQTPVGRTHEPLSKPPRSSPPETAPPCQGCALISVLSDDSTSLPVWAAVILAMGGLLTLSVAVALMAIKRRSTVIPVTSPRCKPSASIKDAFPPRRPSPHLYSGEPAKPATLPLSDPDLAGASDRFVGTEMGAGCCDHQYDGILVEKNHDDVEGLVGSAAGVVGVGSASGSLQHDSPADWRLGGSQVTMSPSQYSSRLPPHSPRPAAQWQVTAHSLGSVRAYSISRPADGTDSLRAVH